MLAIGLFQEGETLKYAEIRKEKGAIFIDSLKEMDVKPLYINAEATLTTAINSWDLLYRKTTIPLGTKRKALAALPFQLETLIPFPIEEAITFPIFKRSKPNETSALLFSIKESAVHEHLNWAHSLEIDPDLVSLTPIALYRLVKFLFPKEPNASFLYWGQHKSFVLSLIDNEIALIHTLHSGKKAPTVEWKKELERFSVFFKTKNPHSDTTQWMIFGDTDPQASLTPIFAQAISPHFLSKEGLPINWEDIQNYTIPIGLCLNTFASDDHAIQLLQGKWASKKRINIRKKQLLSYGLCALSLLIVAALGSHVLIHKKTEALKTELLSYLPETLNRKPIDEIEPMLFQWEKGLSSQKLAFPFLPNVPSVSDVLAWASSHPNLTTPEGRAKEGMEIKSIRYHLYKRPKLGGDLKPYEVRVELEFLATTPRLAREFHDALLAGDSIVNHKKDIQWNAQHNTYFTSFDLKALPQGGSS